MVSNQHNYHLRYAKVHKFFTQVVHPNDGNIQTGEVIVGGMTKNESYSKR
mgnify:CR=1 FL=1